MKKMTLEKPFKSNKLAIVFGSLKLGSIKYNFWCILIIGRYDNLQVLLITIRLSVVVVTYFSPHMHLNIDFLKILQDLKVTY